MCLTLKETPYSWEHGLIVRTNKLLIRGNGRYYGYWQGDKVSNTGWIARKVCTYSLKYDKSYHGEFVHSYLKPSYFYGTQSIMSYSIGVLGYGRHTRQDVGSLLLYVPAADQKNRKKTVKALKSVIKSGLSRRYDMLMNILPDNLANILEKEYVWEF